MPKVLVLDANQRSALAIIRSLGHRGLTVIAADATARPLGGASRFAHESARYSDPATSPDAFLSDISDLVERMAVDTIIPVTDLTTMLLASQPNWSRFTVLASPSRGSYEALTDKARLVELAQSLAIPVPMTRIAHTRDAIREAAHEVHFPLVLKPARSRFLKNGRILSTAVEAAENAPQLDRILDRSEWIDDIPCLVQQFVRGHGAGVFAAYSAADPVAWFAHRRIREKPPSGGVSVLSESAPADPVMQAAASKILSAVGWSGVAMVEFRVGEDGTPYLMEVNGRFWGSLQLAVDCGIDFPWLMYHIAHGREAPGVMPYPLGRRLRWLLGDLDSLVIDLRRSRTTVPQKLASIGRFLATFADFRCRQEVFRFSDPYPGLRELVQWTANL